MSLSSIYLLTTCECLYIFVPVGPLLPRSFPNRFDHLELYTTSTYNLHTYPYLDYY